MRCWILLESYASNLYIIFAFRVCHSHIAAHFYHLPLMPAKNPLTTRTRDRGGKYASTVPVHSRRCSVCTTKDTTQWRTSSDGKSVCNKCGIKLRRRAAKARRQQQQQRLPSIDNLFKVAESSKLTPKLPSIRHILDHPIHQHRF